MPDSFSAATREWFTGAFTAPTAAQVGAWNAISKGEHALVVAPTGSGKTLAAFLWALDRLAAEPRPPDRLRRCRVLYVSPLKALAVDVQRNLRSPLTGISHAARRLGDPEPTIEVSIRTGDTPADQRRRFGRSPSDILITTPESLFLLLTSSAREALRGVETVIVDEVHAVAGTKRGAHLALSLQRLDALLDAPAQRIGLSATVRPTETVAGWLGDPVTVVQPDEQKHWDLRVVVPVEDMTELGGSESTGGGPMGDDGRPDGGPVGRASIWPHVEERIAGLIEDQNSTLVFANSRRLAERLTARLNEIKAERFEAEQLETAQPEAGDIPAQLMGQAGIAHGAPPVLAKSHHGSVSKQQRALIEDELKTGRLPSVVATSSLELGIDMGAVDLVVQVEAPPSVASGLQRVGRAGHQVGAVSRGVIFPKYRGDLISTAVVTQRMREGLIEQLRVPSNPLDVLAQQVVATVAGAGEDGVDVDELYALVCRTAPFRSLPRSAYDAVLDMLTGRYPSDDFAELRPRLVWDRVAGTLTPRPGAQRLAVTSGGTIPDRGLFAVYLVGSGTEGPPSRVGELDEEMVYESRVGDVFTLGTSTWRIEDITHDRVLVSPAPGQPGRLPFWRGDTPSRPAELGKAIGSFVRELKRLDDAEARERLAQGGLDRWACDNVLAYLAEQRQAAGHVPDDRTIVVERFRDELGDWRVCLHTPFGGGVHAPWALAIETRLHERYGVDAQAVWADDGIVLRIPDTDQGPPGAEIAVFDPQDIEQVVTDAVSGSALFASRFRECAARALLLPRRDPGRRAPLWQQRQRSAQLLQVAGKYGSFPIVLETVREVLQDVYDLPGLHELLADIGRGTIRMVAVETAQPSPYARSLTFGYIAAFMYEGDAPLAERKAAALTLDAALLSELLGHTELSELLDADVVEQTALELQRLAPDRRMVGLEGVADLLRLLGPLTTAEVAERCKPDRSDTNVIQASGETSAEPSGETTAYATLATSTAWLQSLAAARRVIQVRIAGSEAWAAIEDAGRLRDALGVPLPVGVPEAFTEPVADPLGDLIGRYARTHGPFLVSEAAARFGLGTAVVSDVLGRLAGDGRVVQGSFRSRGAAVAGGARVEPHRAAQEWCDAGVLRTLRRRSLAALRQEVEPVSSETLARFLPAWQGIDGDLRGVEGVLRVVEQLAGSAVPASALEPFVLASRVIDYSPAMLDELTASGEVLWAGHGPLPGDDGWVSLHVADSADLTLPDPDPDFEPGQLHQAMLDVLDSGGAFFFRQLADLVAGVTVSPGLGDADLTSALWDLVWAGRLTGDTLAPLRALIGSGRTAHRSSPRPPRARYGRRPGRSAMPSRTGPPTAAGRWSLLPPRESDPTRRAHAIAEALLDRHGVVTRGAAMAERVPGGYAAVYPVLSAFEESGRCRRGYFVSGLGAAQFASPGAVDRLRSYAGDDLVNAGDTGGTDPERPTARATVLAATDPANPYGAALAWPEHPGRHRPARKAGALIVLWDGDLVLYVERGGRSFLTWSEQPEVLQPAANALAGAVKAGLLGKLSVQRVDGIDLMAGGLDSPIAGALTNAGFHLTPKGLRLRP